MESTIEYGAWFVTWRAVFLFSHAPTLLPLATWRETTSRAGWRGCGKVALPTVCASCASRRSRHAPGASLLSMRCLCGLGGVRWGRVRFLIHLSVMHELDA